MPTQAHYSPLETLLLFQHLYAFGIDPPVFARIADKLKADPLVTSASAYDATRLSPNALEEYFVRILQDEATQSTSDPEATNGSSSQNPRKRKAPSPTLPSIQQAKDNAGLLPQLIIKLYARYREQVVAEIREEEKIYDRLKEEVAEIERGEWDAQLQKQLEERKAALQIQQPNGNTRATPTPQTIRHSERLTQLEPGRPTNHGLQRTPSPTSTNIELPKTVPRHPPPQVIIQKASQNAVAISPQPPYRTATPGQAHPPYTRSGDRSASPLVPVIQGPKAGQQTNLAPGVRAQRTQSPRGISQGPATPRLPVSQQSQPQSPASGVESPIPSKPNQQPVSTATLYPSQRGGVMLQPFQVSPQVPTSVTRLQAAHQQATTPIQGRTALSPRTATPAPSTPVAELSRPRPVPNPLILTMVQGLSKIKTPPISPARWKNTPPTRPLNAPPSPKQPRSVSPVSDQPASPEQAVPKTRRQKQEQAAAALEQTAPSTRATRGSSRRTRGASTTSSVIGSSVRGRTRSQSVVSHVSADESASKRVKNEPPSTPMDTASDAVDDTPMPAPPRRGPSTRNKRKRSLTAASETSEVARAITEEAPEFAPKSSVLAVRNFSRLSTTIMNDIASHKHASTFSVPVRDKIAKGYSDMILVRTDLKSIKTAIGAGARAINAATESDSQSSASNASALILPWSDELVPPKGIVNSAQLEREVMRMFANAVMFNPGEDGVVADAREMFGDAEVKLVNFREAEKGAETGVRESTGALEDENQSAPGAKKRKMG
jgi:hypothetical protein